MKQTINEYEFIKAFEEIRPDNFSRAGLEALYDYLTEYEAETETELELDVIAICCDFTEYENIVAFQSDYGDKYESFDDIEQMTAVIKTDGDAFIIQAF